MTLIPIEYAPDLVAERIVHFANEPFVRRRRRRRRRRAAVVVAAGGRRAAGGPDRIPHDVRQPLAEGYRQAPPPVQEAKAYSERPAQRLDEARELDPAEHLRGAEAVHRHDRYAVTQRQPEKAVAVPQERGLVVRVVSRLGVRLEHLGDAAGGYPQSPIAIIVAGAAPPPRRPTARGTGGEGARHRCAGRVDPAHPIYERPHQGEQPRGRGDDRPEAAPGRAVPPLGQGGEREAEREYPVGHECVHRRRRERIERRRPRIVDDGVGC